MNQQEKKNAQYLTYSGQCHDLQSKLCNDFPRRGIQQTVANLPVVASLISRFASVYFMFE